MPSCWGHLSWEGLWHKPKQMLIAELYEAAVQAPKGLIGLDQPCLGPPPTPCPWPRGPISAQPQAPSPALRNAGGVPLPKLLLRHPGLTSHLAGGLANAWWSLDCHLNLTLLTNTKKPFTCQARFCTGDLVYMTNIFEHFMFQGLTLISVSLNGLTSKVPMN